MTDYVMGNDHKYTDDGFDGNILLTHVDEFLFWPIAPPRGIMNRDIEYKSAELAGRYMDCGLYQFYIRGAGYPLPPKEALCVSQDTHDFIFKQSQRMSIRFEDFAPFQGQSIARTIIVSEGPLVRARIHIDKLDTAMPSDDAFSPPADASDSSPAPDELSMNSKEDTPTHRVAPAYPRVLDQNRNVLGGLVSLEVLISRSGKIKDIEPLESPSPAFTQAATDAVKQWVYPPLIRHGGPVETITTVMVNFAP